MKNLRLFASFVAICGFSTSALAYEYERCLLAAEKKQEKSLALAATQYKNEMVSCYKFPAETPRFETCMTQVQNANKAKKEAINKVYLKDVQVCESYGIPMN